MREGAARQEGLVALFAREIGRRLTAVERELEAGARDRRRLEREAHTIRGSAAVLGLADVERAARELEDAVGAPGGGARPPDVAAAQRAVGELRALVAALPPGEAAAPPPAAPASDKAVVLLVEDSSANARLAGRILGTREGLAVLWAESGEEACALAAEQPPALVLLDLHLPDLEPEEVVRRLRELPASRDVPVGVLTGAAASERIEPLEALGVRDVLLKPYGAEDLLAFVDALLRR